MAGREDTAAPVSTGAACLLTPQRELRRESPHRTSTTEACALGVGTPGAASDLRRAAYSLQ